MEHDEMFEHTGCNDELMMLMMMMININKRLFDITYSSINRIKKIINKSSIRKRNRMVSIDQ